MGKTFNNQTIVTAIASFDTDGNIKPLFVRILGEEYKILSSWIKPDDSFSSNMSGVIKYQVKVNVRGQAVSLELTYWGKERIWTIPSDIK